MARNGLQRSASRSVPAGLAVAIAAGTLVATLAAAQTPESVGTPTPSLNVPEAPVGHRQPRPADLPPSVLRDEQSNVPAQNAPAQNSPQARRDRERERERQDSTFGGLPTICVRC